MINAKDMMKHSFLIVAACMMAGLSACSDEGDTAEICGQPADNVIRVTTTGVAPNATATVTRAGYETSNLEEFGFFVNNPVSAMFTYGNVRMSRTEDGGWKAADEVEMFWMSRFQPVTVLAYAPYREGDYTVSSKMAVNALPDQSDERNVMASDFIGMKVDNFLPKIGEGGDLTEDGMVPVTMRHLMSKLRITVEYPGRLNSPDAANPVTEMRIGGVALKGVCDFDAWKEDGASSAVVVDGESAGMETVIPFVEDFFQGDEGGTAVYECILVPQVVDKLQVSFVVGGVPYAWEKEALELEASTIYRIRLKIVSRKVELGGDVAVDEWQDGGKEEVMDELDMKSR